MRKLRALAGMLPWIVVFYWPDAVRRSRRSKQRMGTRLRRAVQAADKARGIAEASLGKGAEVLAQGDLARNGREQLLVANRFSPGPGESKGDANPATIYVTRAAVLEENDGKWSEILLCDEHLKNPNGYLGGSTAAPVTGWRLEFTRDAKAGLEMKFTPAERPGAEDVNEAQSSGANRPAFDVRWNKSAKRYQSYDQSHERYLSEVPSLETPQSILK